MSRNLLTLEQAKREVRLLIGEADSSDGDAEADAFDPLIEELIPEVSEIIIGYLKDAADEFMDSDGNVDADSDGNPDIPGDVRNAARLLFRHRFEQPDDNSGIPTGVAAILKLRRTPTLA